MRLWSSLLLAIALAACSGESPPIDELSLRDALGVAPGAIAQLTLAQQRALAERLESARRAQTDSETLAPQKTPEGDVRVVDEARHARGADALIVAIEDATTVHAHPADVSTQDALPPLEGTPAVETLDAETRALNGRAGAVLVELLRAANAKRLVRVTQWPVAAVAIEDAVYVNAGWLVLMASLEPDDAGPPRPTLAPAAIRGNPYSTYVSLAACTNDVSTRCSGCIATGGCDEKATLTDFPSGRDECVWLVADQNRIAQLCAAAMMSMSTVARCVRDRSGCSITNPVNTIAGIQSAAAFLASPQCVSALNACLSGEQPSTAVFNDAGTQNSSPSQVKGCQDPFTSCAASFKACDNACKSGSCSGKNGDSCSKTSDCSSCSSCSSTKGDACNCSKSSSSGSSSSGSSNNCGGSNSNCSKCETSSPVDPFLPPIALLAPILYLALRSRRRA